ncbi:hypothetical protein [Rufibacter roseus]|uniref:Tetratricopeptide repeat protein n=1 Tax=Rufibacter roseus TaxID=1567108 RepID=A0ABW2DKG0_9BACT|nr:hypothetical protein [Rufibacter roseus]
MNRHDKQTLRNIQGKEFEKSKQSEKAALLYEENIKEEFDGTHPYERLAIIYKREGRLEDEIRVLESAVVIFTKIAKTGRTDGISKLQKFKTKLEKAREAKL